MYKTALVFTPTVVELLTFWSDVFEQGQKRLIVLKLNEASSKAESIID